MSDIKYAWYTSSVGFRTTTGTSSQFLKADGSLDNSTYALASGTNATGSWANSSNGLENNPTIAGKTMLGNTTSSLQDANNGTIAGYLNSFGTAAGNPDANWWYRLKMLHPNTVGYNGEIALQMSGNLSMKYRRMENGVESGWIKVLDEATNSFISGTNSFRTSGNQYDSMALHAYSDTGIAPAIAFHKAGAYAGSIAMVSNAMYEFRNLAGTDVVNTRVNISYSQGGFVHNGHNDPHKVLVSDGSVAIVDVDVINSGGTLRVQDYFEDISGGVTFYGSQHPHKLVHLVSSDSDIQLAELQPGQRIVIMNASGSLVTINIDSSWPAAYDLPEKHKVTLYVVGNSEYFFYDESLLTPYTP